MTIISNLAVSPFSLTNSVYHLVNGWLPFTRHVKSRRFMISNRFKTSDTTNEVEQRA